MAVQDIKSLFKAAKRRADESEIRRGLMGRRVMGGGWTVTVAGRSGYVHVSMGPNGEDGLAIAQNIGAPEVGGLPVLLKQASNNEYIVHSIDYESGRIQGQYPNVPPHNHGPGSGLGRENDGARVFNNSAISIPDSTATDLTFDSVRIDTNSYFDSANDDRLTAQEAGWYSVWANVAFAHSATGYRRVNLRRSTGLVIASVTQQAITETGIGTAMIASTQSYFLAGQYVVCEVYQSSGGALDVVAAPGVSPEFSMVRIG